MDLYCVKCKMRTSTNDVTIITAKNNRSVLTGKCEVCGIKKFRFVSLDKVKYHSVKDLLKNEEVILQPS